jgi:hypothetical protein
VAGSRNGSFVAALFLGVGAGIACGSSSGPSGFTSTSDAGPDTTSPAADTGPSETGADDAPSDSSLRLFSDGSAVDQSAACTHLNIGILGGPGADASSDFQQWLVSAGTSVTRIQNMAPAPTITAATLQPFDVVVLDWLTRDYTPAEAAVFASFVSAGGGVVSMSGYDGATTDDWHANSLLAPLEVAYTGPLLNGPVTDFATHPITMGLTSVTFAGGYAIADLGGTASTRTPIGYLPNPDDAGNVPVAFAIQMASGRAFVWGDEWIEFDSQWSTLPEIEQLWIQVFAWISPMNKCKLQPPQ